MILKYIVKDEDITETINSILKNKLNISTRLINKLIKLKAIELNNKLIDTRMFPAKNDILKINFNYEEVNSNIVPTKMKLNIVYEDEWILVIDKPANIPVHPSRSHFSDSLSNGVKSYFDSINLHKKIRPVNRLDIDTSGLVIFAKCEYIQECFSIQMKEQVFKKTYLCLVHGILERKAGTISLPINRKPDSIIERCINTDGKPSTTIYKVLKEFDTYSLVECKLKTGRTHQIRVHMAEIGHPLIGDTLYGFSNSQSPYITRQALHSYTIECIHPIYNTILQFKSNLPKDISNLCNI